MSTKKHDVPQELLGSLLADYKKPEDLTGESGLLKQLTKLLVERALDAELTEHSGHDRHKSVADPSGNTRNGQSIGPAYGVVSPMPRQAQRPHLPERLRYGIRISRARSRTNKKRPGTVPTGWRPGS